MNFFFPNTKTIARWAVMSSLLVVSAPLNMAFAGNKAEAQSTPSPALWKLTDEDSEIYLFGTIHILNPDLDWRSAQVDIAFGAAETVIFEAPADASNPDATQALVVKYGLNPAGTTLSSLLSPSSNQQLATILTQYGMDGAAANFEPLRPWFVGVALAALQIQALGGDPSAGVERILGAEAAATGKKVGYFESDEQQMQILSGLSPQAEVFFLEEGLRQAIDDPDQILQLVQAWRIGDQAAINDILVTGMAGQNEVMEALLTRRNFDWAQQIETLMRGSGTVFIAVGAAHLVGRQSVQVYLSEKGIKAVRQ